MFWKFSCAPSPRAVVHLRYLYSAGDTSNELQALKDT